MLRNQFPSSVYLGSFGGAYSSHCRVDDWHFWPPIAPSSSSAKYVMKQILGVVENLSDTIAIMPLDPMDLSCLRGIMLAPTDTPIENYVLFLHIGFPTDRNLPPKIYFENKVWHPKVNIDTGYICGTDNLSVAHISLENMLASIQAMLSARIRREDWPSIVNGEALDQYLDDYQKFEKVSKEWAEKSNEGYGKVKFEDYKVSSIQSLLLTPGLIKYECAFYCQQASKFVWELVAYFVPVTAIYQKSTKYTTETNKLKKLTSFQFDFDQTIRVAIPDRSRDECWSIVLVNDVSIEKERCRYDPRKDNPPRCVIKLEWERTDVTPTRFLEKFKLVGPQADDPIYTSDVCMDPSVVRYHPEILTLQTSLRMLSPLASEWKTIGCNLNISDGKLNAIARNESNRVEDCLREMLSAWLKTITPLPSWEVLAKAVEGIDPSKAAELIKNSTLA